MRAYTHTHGTFSMQLACFDAVQYFAFAQWFEDVVTVWKKCDLRASFKQERNAQQQPGRWVHRVSALRRSVLRELPRAAAPPQRRPESHTHTHTHTRTRTHTHTHARAHEIKRLTRHPKLLEGV